MMLDIPIYEIVLRALMAIIAIYVLFRLGARYLVQLTNFMFITPSSWNKHIDRPRLYLSFFGIGFMVFAIRMFLSAKPILSIPEEAIKILFFFLFLSASLICHFTWTEKFHKAFIPKFQQRLNPISKLKSTIQDHDLIKEIFVRAKSGNYLEGKLDSFERLLKLEVISLEERMIWRHKSPTNKKVANRQSLIEFLSNLFENFEALENKEIINFCKGYFYSDNNDLIISSKNVSDWRNNNSKYLKDISNIIKG